MTQKANCSDIWLAWPPTTEDIAATHVISQMFLHGQPIFAMYIMMCIPNLHVADTDQRSGGHGGSAPTLYGSLNSRPRTRDWPLRRWCCHFCEINRQQPAAHTLLVFANLHLFGSLSGVRLA